MHKHLLFLVILLANTLLMNAQDKNILLPPPQMAGGMPLMQALNERASDRTFSTETLSLQHLSDICWAAWGINRPEQGRRTAPSSRNRQEMSVFVLLEDAVYVYNAHENRLDFHIEGDLRPYSGTQDFVAKAPLNLVFVADMSVYGIQHIDDATENQKMTSWANAGFMSQNVYLYCASEGLATVVRALIPREELHRKLGLKPLEMIVLAQTIGKKP